MSPQLAPDASIAERFARMEMLFATGLGAMGARIDAVCSRLDSIEHRSFGNGQPGEFSILRAKIASLEESRAHGEGAAAGNATTRANDWRFIMGVFAIIGGITAVIAFIWPKH